MKGGRKVTQRFLPKCQIDLATGLRRELTHALIHQVRCKMDPRVLALGMSLDTTNIYLCPSPLRTRGFARQNRQMAARVVNE